MNKVTIALSFLFSLNLFAQDLYTDATMSCHKIALAHTQKIVEKSFNKQNAPRENRIVDADMAVDTMNNGTEWLTVRAKIITYIEDENGQTLNGEYTFFGKFNQQTQECRLPPKPEFHDWWCDGGILGLFSSVKCIN